MTAIVINKAIKNDQSLAVVRPLITIFKILTVLIIILSWFEKAGYNVATILTGLGIGSLAVALAAQKTLENVFGAFTLYFAKPIQAGDFCQFGNVSAIDNRLYKKELRVSLKTTSAQIRLLLISLRALIIAHSKINKMVKTRNYHFRNFPLSKLIH